MKKTPYRDIALRQWYYSDAEAFRYMIKNIDHSLTDGFLPSVQTESGEYSWIKGMVDMLNDGGEFHYAIQFKDKVVGCVNVSRCRGVYNRVGILRIVLLPEVYGWGIGTEVVKRIVQESFRHRLVEGYVCKGPFERLQARIFGHNRAAERILERNGFVLEGTLRNAVFKNGKLYDEKIYGLTSQSPLSEDVAAVPDNKVERIKFIKQILLSE